MADAPDWLGGLSGQGPAAIPGLTGPTQSSDPLHGLLWKLLGRDAPWQSPSQVPTAVAQPVPATPVTVAPPSQAPTPVQTVSFPRPPSTRSAVYPTGQEGGSITLPAQASKMFPSMVSAFEGTGQSSHSTASGPYQFTDPTFTEFLRAQHPDELEKIQVQSGITAPRHDDLTKLKFIYGQEAFNWNATNNAKALALGGIPVNDTTLLGAHFLGASGLAKVWNADPNTPIGKIGLSQQAIQANPEILSGKTAGEVKAYLESKTHALPQPPVTPSPPQQEIPQKTDYSSVGAAQAAGTPPPLTPLDYSKSQAELEAGRPKGAPPMDFSRARSTLEEGRPVPPDMKAYGDISTSDVLGGLARGAGSVRADQPGSFAAALAAMGAGGMGGLSEARKEALAGQERYQQRKTEFAGAESGLERDIVKSQAELAMKASDAASRYGTEAARILADQSNTTAQLQQNWQHAVTQHAESTAQLNLQTLAAGRLDDQSRAQVAFNNAKAEWQNRVSNAETQYQYQLQERGLAQPKVEIKDGLVAVTTHNPMTNETNVQWHNTKPVFEKAEDLLNFTKALNMPGAVGESQVASYIANSGLEPPVARAVLGQLAITNLIKNGAGGAVFGAQYEAARKQAEKYVDISLKAGNKPEEYEKALENEAANLIFNQLQQSGDDRWLTAAARQGSVAAGLLLRGGQ